MINVDTELKTQRKNYKWGRTVWIAVIRGFLLSFLGMGYFFFSVINIKTLYSIYEQGLQIWQVYVAISWWLSLSLSGILFCVVEVRRLYK